MASDKMIQEAWAEFTQLHEDAKRVHANAMQYQRLYNWLSQTFQLFPSSFEGLTPEIPHPMSDLVPFSDIVVGQVMSPPAANPQVSLGTVLGTMAGAAKILQNDMTLAMRRKLNDTALERVEAILKEKGKLHLDSIVEELKQGGWEGFPISDSKALYNALQARARSNDRFVNEGENYWSLVHEVEGGV
jgi:hypothetical protein